MLLEASTFLWEMIKLGYYFIYKVNLQSNFIYKKLGRIMKSMNTLLKFAKDDKNLAL